MRGALPSRPRRHRILRLAAAVALATAWLFTAQAAPETPGPAGAPTAAALMESLQLAWAKRDLPGYLALWRFASEQAREDEKDFATGHFAADRSDMTVQPAPPGDGPSLKAAVQVFSVSEPRARVEQSVFRMESGPEGWTLRERQAAGRLDNLVHLSLDPRGYRADGLSLQLVDFELQFTHGTLFTSPPELGPTLLVFVGDGTVRLRPGPATEKEQLRQFSDHPELVQKIDGAFVRLHPADFNRILVPARLERDPEAALRLPAAQRLYRDQAEQAFVLDASLPGSPWWLLPGVGDALVTFQAGRRMLTYTLTSSAPEDVSFFDRSRRRQVLLYPSAGRDTRYNEDDSRDFDILHHELKVSFDPARYALEAEDTLRLRLLNPVTHIQLRLDDALGVQSIRSAEGGDHLFLRVRQQDTVMVALGPLGTSAEEFTLTVRYAGILYPGTLEQEVQAPGRLEVESDDEVSLEPVVIYTSRTAWYPRGSTDDYATADLTLNVPAGQVPVAGGVRTSARLNGSRYEVQYKLDHPGKYLSVAIGRLFEAGHRDAPVHLQAFAVARLRGDAERSLDMAAEMVRFFQEQFGPCPYPDLNLVLVEGKVPGGHSPPGMVVLSIRPLLLRGALRDDPASFGEFPGFFLAHELAHQWWGQGVAGQNYRERWLSEGAAQYAAALWVRQSQGERAFQRVLAKLARWAVEHTAEGPINLGHRLGHLKGDPQIYRAVVYDKGAYVLHMLRLLVGEAAFRKGLVDYQQAHRYAKAGTDDLRQALEAASGRDLEPYFRQWVFGTAMPKIEARQRLEPAGPGYRTVVDLKVEDLPGPVPLRVSLASDAGPDERTITLSPGGGSWTFETASRPRKVEVNADRGLLARIENR